ncbi:MAG: galactose mutarotase [Lachnospiraceae bacterium]|nr:galactose mutarotase [Lachnospiraceae bacterium]
MSVTVKKFGTTKKGEKISLYTIKNSRGTEAEFTDFGAIWVSFRMKDKNGIVKDLVLGFDEAKPYLKDTNHFGATVGPIANRTAKARFILNGKEYNLKPNDGENNLHTSLKKGFQKCLFKAEADKDKNSVTFSLKKKDMAMGHPGNLNAQVTYTLTDDDAVEIRYHITTDKDTYLNVTNHAYFNLNGHDSGSVFHEKVKINAKAYTPVVKGAIPTGEIAPVDGTPMDFRTAKEVCRDFTYGFNQIEFVNGYDHNFVLDDGENPVREVASVSDDQSGISMKVFTDLPGVQFYTGNWINVESAKGGVSYGPRQGLCLETQYFPNSVNEPKFKKPIYGPDKPFDSVTIYRFDVEK